MAKNKVTQLQFATLMGRSQPAIAKLVQKSVLTRWDDVGALLVEYGKHMSEVAAGRQGEGGNAEFEIVGERGRLAARQSEMLEIALEEKKGKLIPFESFREHFESFAVTIRSKLLSLPSRYRSQFPQMTPKQVDALDLQIREILQELTIERFPTKLRDRLRQRMDEIHATTKTNGRPVGGRVSIPKRRGKRRARKVVDGPDAVHAGAVPGDHKPGS